MADLDVEVQKLTVETLLVLYQLDFSNIPDFTPSIPILYLSNYKDGYNNYVFDTNTYVYVPIVTKGFSAEINGTFPEPTLELGRVQLVNSTDYQTILSEWRQQIGNRPFDWRGVKVTKLKSTKTNFDTNNTTSIEYGFFLIDLLQEEDKSTLKLGLSPTIAADRLTNEAMNALAAGRCSFKYRQWNGSSFEYISVANGGCPYGNPSQGTADFSDAYYQNLKDNAPGGNVDGRYFTNANTVTADPAQDKCSYSVTGCVDRFDPDRQGYEFPFNGLVRPV